MEIWIKYLKFVMVWTIITTGLTFMAVIMFAGEFNGKFITVNWQPFIFTLLILNTLLNIYLVNETKN